jgi:tRNA threonylcarbamoyladenosine biosynthesis protein TsaE
MTIVERLRAGIRTATAEETRAIAAEFAAILPPDVTLALHGDLGVGKTTFVQGLALGWAVAGLVTSPTYTIFTLHRGARLLVHLDAYRLDSPAQMEALLVPEFLESPYCLAIEWPDKIAAWLPPDAWHLDLGIAGNGEHQVRLR